MADKERDSQKNVGELFDLTKAYAVQETVEPIKGLGKFIGLGVAAAATGAVSVVLLLVGVLRLLQRETAPHLTGKLSWVPYLITLAIAAIIMSIALAAIGRKKEPNR